MINEETNPQNEMDRRTFVKMAGIVGAGSVLAGSGMLALSSCSSSEEQEGDQSMQQTESA